MLSWSSNESTVGLVEAGLVAPFVREYPSEANSLISILLQIVSVIYLMYP